MLCLWVQQSCKTARVIRDEENPESKPDRTRNKKPGNLGRKPMMKNEQHILFSNTKTNTSKKNNAQKKSTPFKR